MLNGTVASIIGFYLITVLLSDNEDRLLKEIREEGGFLKWGGALFALYYLYKFSGGKTGELIQQFTILALIALLLSKGGSTFDQLTKFFTEPEKKDAPVIGGAMDYYTNFINNRRFQNGR